MKKGFTLVELSIVLVIIGLLIGGILVGQSLIESSKTTAQIRQIQQLDIAVNNFKKKYKQLPGDSTLLPVAGNGDGVLRGEAGNIRSYGGEFMNFWNQLISTELPNFYKHNNGNGSRPYGSYIMPGINSPKSIIGKNGTVLGMTSSGWLLPLDVPMWHIRNYFTTNYHLFNGAESPDGQCSPLTVLEAMSLDGKMDDGNAITGDVRASDGKDTGNAWNSGINEGCVLTTDYSKYDINQVNVGVSERPCGSIIKMQGF